MSGSDGLSSLMRRVVHAHGSPARWLPPRLIMMHLSLRSFGSGPSRSWRRRRMDGGGKQMLRLFCAADVFSKVVVNVLSWKKTCGSRQAGDGRWSKLSDLCCSCCFSYIHDLWQVCSECDNTCSRANSVYIYKYIYIYVYINIYIYILRYIFIYMYIYLYI